jgi:uncharacterized membrane protein
MDNIKLFNKILKESILSFEIIISFSVLIILFYNVARTLYTTYLKKTKFSEKIKSRLNLIYSISLSLSFILCVEILKFFYIKTYKQLIIVGGLVFIKLVITFFLDREIDEESKKINLN